MIAFGNRWKQNLGMTITEYQKEFNYGSDRHLAHIRESYHESGEAKKWTYYSAGGGLMRLYATAKMAQSRYPKGEVFQVEVPDE